MPAFKTKKYTAFHRFQGNSSCGKISTKKGPIRTLGFTSIPPCTIIIEIYYATENNIHTSDWEPTRRTLTSDVNQTRIEREFEEKDKRYLMFKASSFRDVSHKTIKNSSSVMDRAGSFGTMPALQYCMRQYWTGNGAI